MHNCTRYLIDYLEAAFMAAIEFGVLECLQP
jgi:hypothetical protein